MLALAALAVAVVAPGARADDASGAVAPIEALDSALQAVASGGSDFA